MKPPVICSACGYHGAPRAYGCMQVGILLFLMIFGILPGVLYALYMDAYMKRCPQCDQKSLIPADSPRGQALRAQMGIADVATPPRQGDDANVGRTLLVVFITIFGAAGAFIFMARMDARTRANTDAAKPVVRAAVVPAPDRAVPTTETIVNAIQGTTTTAATTDTAPLYETSTSAPVDHAIAEAAKVAKAEAQARARAEWDKQWRYEAALPHVYVDHRWKMYHAAGCSAVNITQRWMPISRATGYTAHICVPAELREWHGPSVAPR